MQKKKNNQSESGSSKSLTKYEIPKYLADIMEFFVRIDYHAEFIKLNFDDECEPELKAHFYNYEAVKQAIENVQKYIREQRMAVMSEIGLHAYDEMGLSVVSDYDLPSWFNS